jgi:glycine cleavage system H lipoate-binding protein/CheY-like chemotaxis protein
VDMALSGEEALQKESHKHYDLIIADLMMPGISGMDLLRKIKDSRPEVMFIMITGYPSIKTAVQSIKLGAMDYLPKPFTPNDLRSIVKRALARKDLLREEVQVTEEKIKVPGGLFMIPENSWVRVEGDGNVRVGFHHMLLRTIGEISDIEYPKINETRYQGEACLRVIDHEKQIHRLWAPVTGKIITINDLIMGNSDLLNSDPYGRGWVLVMTPTRLDSDLKNLVPSDE